MNELHDIDIHEKSFTSQNVCKDSMRMTIIPKVCKKFLMSMVSKELMTHHKKKKIEMKKT
jgi:hypothetical protein